MLVEIPNQYLETMKNMPSIYPTGKYRMKNGDVFAWIGDNDILSPVITVMIRGAILKCAFELGYVKYDPETGTWKGIDYDD